ncbi:MAG: tetratricopeptide repeat protein [candidate division Zixibacteria bacterium]|nr:tetratricopeptide repeat protein [candidate division Zixibacteria bacterium]
MKRDSSKDACQVNELDLIESLLKEKKFKQALAEIRERATRTSPDRSSCEWGWLTHLAAKALQGLGRCEEALERAQEAFKVFKTTPENDRLAQIQYSLGVICSDLGDFRNAELHLRDAASTYRRVEDRKGITRTYNELSRLCFTTGKYDTAIEYLNDGLRYCQETEDQRLAATVLGNLGTVYTISDRWRKAQRNLRKSLKLNKICKREIDVSRCYLSLGYLSILLRQFSKAKDYLNRAFRIIAENNFTRELAIYHEYSGALELVRGDLEAAHHHLREAIGIGEEIAPKSAIISQSYRLLAELLLEKGDYQQALSSCRKSMQVCKDLGESLEEAANYRTLGLLHSHSDHPDEAKESFAKATRILENMGVKFELARTYQCMGKCTGFEFWERMKFLGRAEDLSSRLDSPYYLATVHADFARLFFENDKVTAAQDFLNRAESVFEQLGETKDVESLSPLEKQIQARQPSGQYVSVNSFSGARVQNSGGSFADIITGDSAVLKILENARQVKDLDVTILLEGETGTGKDLLAKAIHYTSNRKDNKYVVASCAALPESLLESELFGYKKGAFTNAVSDKKGLLDEAHGGTLYLDEIAEVPSPIQVKLLRAIEEKEIMRIGEVKPRKVDFRVIAATNKNLEELVNQGKFRTDLFYRLNVVRFELPPLRERRQDIALLVGYFLKKYWANGIGQNSTGNGQHPGVMPTLDPRIMDLFLNYHWPGNVRELENDIKRLLISSRGEEAILFEHVVGSLDKFINGKICQPISLLDQKARLEKAEIEKALAKANGVKTKAARLLNIDEALLRYKMKKHNITFPPKSPDVTV